MQSLGRRYVQYVNRAHHRSGALWEGRFRASLVEAESHLLTCYRYIELNPVRRLWSSIRGTIFGRATGITRWAQPTASLRSMRYSMRLARRLRNAPRLTALYSERNWMNASE